MRQYNNDRWDLKEYIGNNGHSPRIKLPTECTRCQESFFTEGSQIQWFWIDTEKKSFYVCRECLTPEEQKMFDSSNCFTFQL